MPEGLSVLNSRTGKVLMILEGALYFLHPRLNLLTAPRTEVAGPFAPVFRRVQEREREREKLGDEQTLAQHFLVCLGVNNSRLTNQQTRPAELGLHLRHAGRRARIGQRAAFPWKRGRRRRKFQCSLVRKGALDASIQVCPVTVSIFRSSISERC